MHLRELFVCPDSDGSGEGNTKTGTSYARCSYRLSSDYFLFVCLFISPILIHATDACNPGKGNTETKSIILSAFALRKLNHAGVEFRGSYTTDFHEASISALALNCYKHVFLWLLENSDAKHEPYLQSPGAAKSGLSAAAPAAPHRSSRARRSCEQHKTTGEPGLSPATAVHTPTPHPPMPVGLF